MIFATPLVHEAKLTTPPTATSQIGSAGLISNLVIVPLEAFVLQKSILRLERTRSRTEPSNFVLPHVLAVISITHNSFEPFVSAPAPPVILTKEI